MNLKSVGIKYFVFFIFVSCSQLNKKTSKNTNTIKVKIDGQSELLKFVSIDVDLISLKNNLISKEKIILFTEGKKESDNLPKDVLRFEYHVSFKDSLFLNYRSDNKIKANKIFNNYNFYFFRNNNDIYMNSSFGDMNKEFSNQSLKFNLKN